MSNFLIPWIIYAIVVYLLNRYFLKKKLLRSDTGSKHQLFANDSVPLTGGFFILFPVLYIYIQIDFLLCLYFLLIYLIGFMSDINFLRSPKKRFFLQLSLIILFIFYTKLEVIPTRIDFIDSFIENTFFSYALTVFCLMILINGSNFIDGLNGLSIGYFSIIAIVLFKTDLFYSLGFSNEQFLFLIFVILLILLLNYFNQLFIGDSGAYALSFLMGYSLIRVYNFNENISPYFIILLLWYPCFENLFSIIRKIAIKKNPLKPDNKHFHQYLFRYLILKFNLKKIHANNFASISINTFNLLIFYIGSFKMGYTYHQIILIILSVAFYLLIYKFLEKFLKTKDSF